MTDLNAQAGAEVEESPKEGAETDEDILTEGRERYASCESAESDDRTAAKDDLLFLSGGVNQWDATDATIRTAQKRPMITVNNLPTFLHQVTNELRQNKLGGRVHPVDDQTDDETAEVVQGLIRHIEYDSNASVATNTAVNSAAAIGFGWYRLVTEYESETSFDQKIMFKRIRNALAVHKDPLSQELDGSDSCFYFIDSLEDRKEFKRQYPKANANNTTLIGQDIYKGWFTQDTVLVCEYYRIKETPDTLCMYEDGSTGWVSDKSPLPKKIGKDGKPMERKSARRVVEWFKMTGADILDRTVIKCKWIPVFPVYGDEIDIEGKVIRSGIIRNSKDSFKMYNFCITTAIEEVATRAKSPYIMAEGQDEGHEAQWANINRIPYSSVKYKPTTVDNLLVPPPARVPMADIPNGWLSMTMHFADNKKATTGLFDSSLGAKGTATSGIQEREQQAQGDIANYHYADNLKITYLHTLRCIVDMIPHYYDGARMVRMLGEDESTTEVVKVNQPIERANSQTGAIEIITHDLTVGEFDITLSSGPSYSTKRQEAAEFMTDAMQAAKDPAAASVLTYLAIKNQDLAGAEEATSMLKKLLPPGVSEPEDGEEPMVQTPQGPMPVSKVGEVMAQMGQALEQAGQQLEKADIIKKETEALAEHNRTEDLRLKDRELDIKEYESRTARLTADAALAGAQAEKTGAEAEKVGAEQNVTAVAQAAAREAVQIIMNTPPDQLHPEVQAMRQAPAVPPAEPVMALEQPQPEQVSG